MLKLKKPTTNVFLEHFNAFEKTFATNGQPALNRLRKAAIARFAELGWPTERDEEWKFTSRKELTGAAFAFPPEDSQEPVSPFRMLTHGDQPGSTLLTVNQDTPFALNQSNPLPSDVITCSISEAIDKHPQLLLNHLGRIADFKGNAFTALNTAFLRDGVFVYVPDGRAVDGPLFLPVLVSAFHESAPYVWHRRCLIALGRSASLTVVENFGGLGVPYFTNAVTEIVLGENAQLDHYKVQREGDRAFHMHTLQVQQARNSRFSSHAVTLGGAWTRNEVNAILDGEGCECTLNGLYLGNGNRHIDNHTFIDHAKPNCASHELYKGVLADKSHGVFNGKIMVRQDAQKTDAKQTNQTLLLSDDAVINTKPQLEIYADDVKCTHGATVGQLDEASIFYLRSRGIGEQEARALLTFAFANDIVRRIQVEPVRRELERLLLVSRGLPES